MINFLDNGLAASYFVFSLVCVAGLLQLLAAHGKLIGLSLVPPAWHPAVGFIVGTVFLVAPFPIFFILEQPAIFKPGPAGLELLILFGGGTLVGLGLTLAGASLMQRNRRASPEWTDMPSDVRREALDLGQVAGTLYLPGRSGPWPALCAIEDPGYRPGALAPLAEALAHNGYAVLLLQSDSNTAWSYPEVLALAPTACTLLARRDDIAGDRIGLLGFGLGADVALRSGSTDEQVRAIIALAPLLDRAHAAAGLGALQELTLPQAWSWARFRRYAGLLHHLAPLQHLARMTERGSVLLVFGADDGLVDTQGALAAARQSVPGLSSEVVAGRGHYSLLSDETVADVVLRWLKGRL